MCCLTVCFIMVFNGVAEESKIFLRSHQLRGMSTVTGWARPTGLEEPDGTSASRQDILETLETLGLCMAEGKPADA